MAVTDAYALAADYRARIDKADIADDTVIDAQLTAVSRIIDQRCRRFFTQDAVPVARLFDGNGKARVYVADIATTTGLVVKVDQNADYDYADSNETLAISTDFWVGPDNALLGAEPRPFQFVDIIPTSTKLSVFPVQRRAIEVTATWGWPAVPGAIKEATIAITREIRDMQESGFSLTLQTIDQAIQQSPTSAVILMDIVRRYGFAPGV